jgi:hypothetical protein
VVDGSITHNPRDALVTIIAFTDGEEWFKDDNGNAQYDLGEQFIDQGEPFVDTNDNNVYDGSDTYIDTNHDNMWNPPNGVWDGTTTVWKRFSVLYTNVAQSFVASPSTFDVAKGGIQTINYFALDQNMNPPDQPTSVAFTFSSTKGTASFATQPRFDNYGFDWEENYLANAAGDGPCIDSTPICRYRAIFKTWASGFIGTATINGAPTTDTNPAVAAQAQVTVTTRSVPVQFTVNGTVE